MADPLQVRLDLLNFMIEEGDIPEESKASVIQELAMLNTYSLAENWNMVDLWIEKWAQKSTHSSLNCKKWKIGLEIALDANDLELLSRLITLAGKHKKMKIALSLMALALEKQNDALTDQLLIGCTLQAQIDTGVLGGLPPKPEKTRQVLFNRYCILSDNEIAMELFGTMDVSEISPKDIKSMITEHRLAMISYLSRGPDKLMVNEDTIWSSMQSGNNAVVKLLQSLKQNSLFSWMENVSNEKQLSSVFSNLPDLKEDEEYHASLALYSAYGGKMTGIDKAALLALESAPPPSPKSYTKYISSKGVDRSGAKVKAKTSQMSREIVNSANDNSWVLYLKGDSEKIPELSWMEPAGRETTILWNKNETNANFESINEEEKAIIQGYGVE